MDIKADDRGEARELPHWFVTMVAIAIGAPALLALIQTGLGIYPATRFIKMIAPKNGPLSLQAAIFVNWMVFLFSALSVSFTVLLLVKAAGMVNRQATKKRRRKRPKDCSL